MSALSFRSRSARTRLPLALLAAGALLTLVAVAEAYRTSRSNDTVKQAVVRDYSMFVAWAFANLVEELLISTAREVVGAVDHGDQLHTSPNVPSAADLVHLTPYDSLCGCHRPAYGPIAETFFAFEITADTLGVAVNTHPDPSDGWEIDRPLEVPAAPGLFLGYSDADRVSILRTLKSAVRHEPRPPGGFRYMILPLERGTRTITFITMPTGWGDTIVYGAQYTQRSLADALGQLMDQSDLLPGSFNVAGRNRDLVDIIVSHGDEAPLFVSGDSTELPGAATAMLGPRFASLQVRAAIKPAQASTLVVGGLPRSRLPFLVGLLLLSASLTVVAVGQLRREGELGRLRSEWVASVSHELRTPLAQIRLYLDTVRLGRAPSEERRTWALDQVDRETTRLGHLVEKVLTFSRLGEGAGRMQQVGDVPATVRQIVAEFRPLAESRGAKIDLETSDSSVVVLRRDGLRHVLLNLLDNAVKYGPEGQTIRVSVEQHGAELLLSVTDEGPGLPRGEREAIWRPFARGTTSRSEGGSGIGLAIVREIATEAGGRSWVEDGPGRGARFVVSIPIATGVE